MSWGFKNLQWELITNGFSQWKNLRPQYYVSKDGTLYCIPENSSSDLASTPPEVWGPPLFLPKCGWYAPAAWLHDLAYSNTLLVVKESGLEPANLTKSESDDLILEAMMSLRPNPSAFEMAQINAIITGLKIGGWKAFSGDRS